MERRIKFSTEQGTFQSLGSLGEDVGRSDVFVSEGTGASLPRTCAFGGIPHCYVHDQGDGICPKRKQIGVVFRGENVYPIS